MRCVEGGVIGGKICSGRRERMQRERCARSVPGAGDDDARRSPTPAATRFLYTCPWITICHPQMVSVLKGEGYKTQVECGRGGQARVSPCCLLLLRGSSSLQQQQERKNKCAHNPHPARCPGDMPIPVLGEFTVSCSGPGSCLLLAPLNQCAAQLVRSSVGIR